MIIASPMLVWRSVLLVPEQVARHNFIDQLAWVRDHGLVSSLSFPKR